VIATIAGTAEADEASVAGVRIAVEAPDACPGASGVASRLEAAIEDAALTPTAVHIAVERGGAGFELELVIGGDLERSRTLEGADCEALVDAAVLILSLALMPDEPTQAPEGDNQVADAELPALAPPEPAGFEEDPPEVVAKATPAVPISLSVGAAAAVDGGTLPGIAPGVGLAVSARRAGLTLDLAATYFPTHRTIVDAEMGHGAELNALAVNLRGCQATGPLWLCVGGELNLLNGIGVGLESAEKSRFSLWGFTGAARYQRVIAERLSMAATAEVVGHPARPAYFIDDPRRLVHRPSWLSVRLWLVGQVVIF
jgi:hypothetical protein